MEARCASTYIEKQQQTIPVRTHVHKKPLYNQLLGYMSVSFAAASVVVVGAQA